MKIEDLKIKYDLLQNKYGDKSLDSIYNGGCDDNPDICFVFMKRYAVKNRKIGIMNLQIKFMSWLQIRKCL